MTQVSLHQVTKAFDETLVIPELDLEIADREFVVLVGPSGCGKTTTLRMIAGLEPVTSGRVMFGDRDVTGLRPGKRNCAMVFQNYALYPHMTVRENIIYGMRVRGTPLDQATAAVEDAARILDLEPYLERQPKHLSGGQRQRVAIGRAIVRDPDVFLFDEPLSNLDAKLRIEMRVEIKALHRRLGNTIVYVTHDQVEAMTLADKVVVMNQGRIEQSAEPIQLYEKPANLFVAGFIGAPSMNFIEGRIADGAFASSDGSRLPLPAGHTPAQLPAEVVCGIRPEHMAWGDFGAPKLKLSVKVIEPLGPHTLLVGTVAGAPFTAQAPVDTDAQPEGEAEVPIDVAKIHLFDRNSGQRLAGSG